MVLIAFASPSAPPKSTPEPRAAARKRGRARRRGALGLVEPPPGLGSIGYHPQPVPGNVSQSATPRPSPAQTSTVATFYAPSRRVRSRLTSATASSRLGVGAPRWLSPRR